MCVNSVQVTVLVELGSVSFLTENLRMASDKSENCLVGQLEMNQEFYPHMSLTEGIYAY